MLFKSLALLAMSAISSAKLLEMMMFKVANSNLDLGGGSTSSSEGLLYRIDGSEWQEVGNEKDTAACAYLCDSNGESPAYWIPELDNNKVFFCLVDFDKGACVPGNSVTCRFRYGDIYAQYDSTSDSQFWGFGAQVGTYCGGPVAEVDL